MRNSGSSRDLPRLTQVRTALVQVVPRHWRLLAKRILREASPRGRRARKEQGSYLREIVPSTIDRAVVFVVGDRDRVNGGILAIFSLAQESEKLIDIHGARVELATLPGRQRISRFTRFSNNRVIMELPDIVRRMAAEGHVLLHVPECWSPTCLSAAPHSMNW